MREARTCPVCQSTTLHDWCCGIDLTARAPWSMTREAVRAVHVLALSTKGLDEDTYRMRLRAVGVESSKNLSREQFATFLAGLRALPNAPKARKGKAA